MSITTLTWFSCGHNDEPRDQQTDLCGPYWASIGPDNRRRPDEWSWTVFDFDQDNADVASDFAPDEETAKSAVALWAKEYC